MSRANAGWLGGGSAAVAQQTGHISVVARWLQICSCGWFSLSATRTSKAGACRASISRVWGGSVVHARHSSNLLHTLLACLARPTTEYHTRTCVEPPRDYTYSCPAVAHGWQWRAAVWGFWQLQIEMILSHTGQKQFKMDLGSQK